MSCIVSIAIGIKTVKKVAGVRDMTGQNTYSGSRSLDQKNRVIQCDKHNENADWCHQLILSPLSTLDPRLIAVYNF